MCTWKIVVLNQSRAGNHLQTWICSRTSRTKRNHGMQLIKEHIPPLAHRSNRPGIVLPALLCVGFSNTAFHFHLCLLNSYGKKKLMHLFAIQIDRTKKALFSLIEKWTVRLTTAAVADRSSTWMVTVKLIYSYSNSTNLVDFVNNTKKTSRNQSLLIESTMHHIFYIMSKSNMVKVALHSE